MGDYQSGNGFSPEVPWMWATGNAATQAGGKRIPGETLEMQKKGLNCLLKCVKIFNRDT